MKQRKTMVPAESPDNDIRIGISACILGEEVRYNGGHKLDRFIRDTLGAHVRFVPLCPELDIGLGVPRESIRLERDGGGTGPSIRLVAPRSGKDHTRSMLSYARRKTKALEAEDLCGFIVQKGSPSCGMERVRVYNPRGGAPGRSGRGLFTGVLMERMPNLPVEEDGRLNDPALRENFVERVFAYRRLRTLFSGRWTIGGLVEFHSREKLLLLAHDRPAYQELGRLVAGAKRRARKDVATEYERLFMSALARLATRGKQTNVLTHIAGHFKKLLDAADREEIRDVIESYRRGLVPVIVPITLLRHHVRRHGIEYLAQQTYLDPHPRELMLRNHV
jgi:uncharacterized protein YbgA (DUF1722 family)/uncharacterized protein YbbK (DUF523 family)